MRRPSSSLFSGSARTGPAASMPSINARHTKNGGKSRTAAPLPIPNRPEYLPTRKGHKSQRLRLMAPPPGCLATLTQGVQVPKPPPPGVSITKTSPGASRLGLYPKAPPRCRRPAPPSCGRLRRRAAARGRRAERGGGWRGSPRSSARGNAMRRIAPSPPACSAAPPEPRRIAKLVAAAPGSATRAPPGR